MLPELLAQIPPDEPITSIGGDGAYDTKACHAAIRARGAQAVIPPQRNAGPCKASDRAAVSRNEAQRAVQRLVRAASGRSGAATTEGA